VPVNPRAEAFEAGRRRWPEIALSADCFSSWCAERSLGDGAAHGEDLFLACACLAGLPSGLRAFEAAYLPRVPEYLARLRPTASLIEEVSQLLRERLFVGNSPRIAEYSGKGSLGAWLRVVAARVAINFIEANPRRTQPLNPRSLAAVTTSPELVVLRNRYRGRFKLAFAAALERLSSEQRTLLKLHYLDGVPMEALGALFKVNRTTIFRRLGVCSKALFDDIRAQLGDELGISTAELNSLAAALQSDFELSLGDYLRSR
jgi:RNA polymerase sigma-70 factor, ECF subfamily